MWADDLCMHTLRAHNFRRKDTLVTTEEEGLEGVLHKLPLKRKLHNSSAGGITKKNRICKIRCECENGTEKSMW